MLALLFKHPPSDAPTTGTGNNTLTYRPTITKKSKKFKEQKTMTQATANDKRAEKPGTLWLT
ncbi:MAG: hypothetical protein PHP53_24205, partial [Prolixibacteraceae bacterium]|nr:hypothetical protein [Prolixibacteraceae bacterium]